MILPEFILAHNRTELPGPVIIQTRPPYIVAGIRMEKSEDEFAAWLNNYKGFVVGIKDYNVAIYYITNLTNERVSSFTVMYDLKRMTHFYKTERLEHKPKFYKKYAKQQG